MNKRLLFIAAVVLAPLIGGVVGASAALILEIAQKRPSPAQATKTIALLGDPTKPKRRQDFK